MSLTKQAYFDQLQQRTPEDRVLRIAQSIEIAARIINADYKPSVSDLEVAERRLYAVLRELDALAVALDPQTSETF